MYNAFETVRADHLACVILCDANKFPGTINRC